jgi:hypothetical protein
MPVNKFNKGSEMLTVKTMSHWWKKSEDGKTSHAHGSVESVLWKWSYYQKQTLCSM